MREAVMGTLLEIDKESVDQAFGNLSFEYGLEFFGYLTHITLHN